MCGVPAFGESSLAPEGSQARRFEHAHDKKTTFSKYHEILREELRTVYFALPKRLEHTLRQLEGIHDLGVLFCPTGVSVAPSVAILAQVFSSSSSFSECI